MTGGRLRVLAQRRDRGRVIFRFEDGRAGDDHVATGARDLGDVVDLDAAVDLDVDVEAAFAQLAAQIADLGQHAGDERLPAEARVHRHDQDLRDVAEHVAHVIDGRGRIERHRRALAGGADLLQHAVQVAARLDVHADEVGARAREVVDVAIGIFDHEVHVERLLRGLAHRRDHDGADGQVGHEAAVHHVDVDVIGAGSVDRAHLFGEAAEVRGQNRRRDLDDHFDDRTVQASCDG